MKSTLFKMIICIFLFLLYKVDFKKYLGIAFLSLAVLSLLEWIALGTNVLSTVIVRRVLMIPQVLDSFYYDFTLNNGPLYYGGYHGEDVSFAIGAQYWSNGEIRANNGFFSDFYINIGFIGCIIYPLLYVIFFQILRGGIRKVKSSNSDVRRYYCYLYFDGKFIYNFTFDTWPFLTVSNNVCYTLGK